MLMEMGASYGSTSVSWVRGFRPAAVMDTEYHRGAFAKTDSLMPADDCMTHILYDMSCCIEHWRNHADLTKGQLNRFNHRAGFFKVILSFFISALFLFLEPWYSKYGQSRVWSAAHNSSCCLFIRIGWKPKAVMQTAGLAVAQHTFEHDTLGLWPPDYCCTNTTALSRLILLLLMSLKLCLHHRCKNVEQIELVERTRQEALCLWVVHPSVLFCFLQIWHKQLANLRTESACFLYLHCASVILRGN